MCVPDFLQDLLPDIGLMPSEGIMAHTEQHKAYKRELTKVILIWVGAIVLIIIDIILFTKFL